MDDTFAWPVFDYDKLQKFLADAQDGQELQNMVVNAPFVAHRAQTAFLFLGIIVLLLVDKTTNTIDRIALSNTELAKNTTEVSFKPFNDIVIPIDNQENIIAQAIASNEPRDTTDWKYLFAPALTAEQARLNQASGGIAYSAVWPLSDVDDGGALIFSYFQYQHGIGLAQHEFMDRYSELVIQALTRPKS